MKGVVGIISCDEPECPNKFIEAEMHAAKGESLKRADAAEAASVSDGWTLELRTRAHHYCPAHSAARRQRKIDDENKARRGRQEP